MSCLHSKYFATYLRIVAISEDTQEVKEMESVNASVR